MRNKNSKFIISNNERIHFHLVVSKDTHDVVKLYATSNKISLTEATQRLLASAFENLIRERDNARR